MKRDFTFEYKHSKIMAADTDSSYLFTYKQLSSLKLFFFYGRLKVFLSSALFLINSTCWSFWPPSFPTEYQEVHGLINGMLTSFKRIRSLIKGIVVSWPHAQRNKGIGPHFPRIKSRTLTLPLYGFLMAPCSFSQGVRLQQLQLKVILLHNIKKLAQLLPLFVFISTIYALEECDLNDQMNASSTYKALRATESIFLVRTEIYCLPKSSECGI